VILFRYAARRALVAMLGALAAVVALYVAVDFVDNSASWAGKGWVPAAIELYANKSLVIARMVAPAAILLGASVAVSGFRATREWTAMRALGLGPWRLAVPVLAVTFGAGVLLVVVHDAVGVRAAQRAEELGALRFGRGGDKRRFLASREPKRWFRGADGRHIYYLRGQLPGGGFEHVTVLEVDPTFRLVRRIDAERMHPDAGEWILEDVEDRTFGADGTMTLATADERRYRFDEPPDAFSVVPGRPSEMRMRTLVQQIDLRLSLRGGPGGAPRPRPRPATQPEGPRVGGARRGGGGVPPVLGRAGGLLGAGPLRPRPDRARRVGAGRALPGRGPRGGPARGVTIS